MRGAVPALRQTSISYRLISAVLLAGEGRHETIVAIVGMDGLNHTGEKEQRLRRAAIKDSGIVATAKV